MSHLTINNLPCAAFLAEDLVSLLGFMASMGGSSLSDWSGVSAPKGGVMRWADESNHGEDKWGQGCLRREFFFAAGFGFCFGGGLWSSEFSSSSDTSGARHCQSRKFREKTDVRTFEDFFSFDGGAILWREILFAVFIGGYLSIVHGWMDDLQRWRCWMGAGDGWMMGVRKKEGDSDEPAETHIYFRVSPSTHPPSLSFLKHAPPRRTCLPILSDAYGDRARSTLTYHAK